MKTDQVKQLRLVLILSLLTLFGCTASVRIGREYADHPTIPTIPATELGVECHLYFRTGYDAIPALPNLQGRKVTSEELNIIQAYYIQELRQFVADERARLDADYSAYLKRCIK